MKKLFLNIDELQVESFVTTGTQQGRGTVVGHGLYTRDDQWTQPDLETIPPMQTILECPTFANDCPTLGEPGCGTTVGHTMDCPTDLCASQEGYTCYENCTSICQW